MIHRIWRQKSSTKTTYWFVCLAYKTGGFTTKGLSKDVPPTEVPNNARLVPFNRIRLIESKADSRILTIYYDKESKFEHTFDDVRVKTQVLDYLHHNTAVTTFSDNPEGILSAIRKPLYAFIGLAVLLGLSYHTALLLENDVGMVRQFIVVLFIAGFGSRWVAILMAVASIVIALRIYIILADRAPVYRLYYNHQK